MKTNKKEIGQISEPIGHDFFDRFQQEGWTYIKTVVDVVREPVLILDSDFRVMAANEPFYRTFHVEVKDTEKKIIYELGNGQWDIPSLRKLLEDILPKHTFFKGFQVAHEFPSIGRKVMILNARQVYVGRDPVSEVSPPIIMLAMEDVTEIMMVAEMLANHAKELEAKFLERIGTLEREMSVLKNNESIVNG
jgi:PAS domain-containing protein